MVERFSERLGRLINKRPWLFIALALIITAICVPGLALLKAESGYDTMIKSSSTVYQDNMRYEEQFGDSAMVVMLSGSMENIFAESNWEVIKSFEQEFSEDERFLSIYSPNFVFNLAAQGAEKSLSELTLQRQALAEQAAAEAKALAISLGLDEAAQEAYAEGARQQVYQQFESAFVQIEEVLDAAYNDPLKIVNGDIFISDDISAQLDVVIPDSTHAMLFVTTIGNLSDSEMLQIANDVETYLRTSVFSMVDTTVVADSKMIKAIGDGISNSIMLLFGISVVIMTALLYLLFRVRWRLISLVMVGFGVLWTFGLMGYAGIPLSMATMAVLPILVGLGIDYSIQFHNRYQEEIRSAQDTGKAVVSSVKHMLPVVGFALLATLIGFISLYISELPMIRDFGIILAVGVALSCIVALFMLNGIITVGDRKTDIKKLQASAEKAGDRSERALSLMGRVAFRVPLVIIILATGFGIAGGVYDQKLPINTDYEQLMPQDMQALKEVKELREVLGSGLDLRFFVESDDITERNRLETIYNFQQKALAQYPELLGTDGPVDLLMRANDGVMPEKEQAEAILSATPQFFVSKILSEDRTKGVISFNAAHMELEETGRIIDGLAEMAESAGGMTIAPVGTLALGSAAMNGAVGTRGSINLICISAVFLILLLLYRDFMKALFTIIPVGLVIAWTSLAMYALGIPLNPLTAIMGVLIVGIGTEFMVLLIGRYSEERKKGTAPRESMLTAISRIGRAIAITALTTLGGFGALVASDFVLIRDFGIATVLGVFFCLISTIVVMPPLIVWVDERREKLIRQKANR